MLFVDFVVAFIVIIYRENFAHLFTSNPDVVVYLNPTFTTMAFLLVIGGASIVLSGALKGLGL